MLTTRHGSERWSSNDDCAYCFSGSYYHYQSLSIFLLTLNTKWKSIKLILHGDTAHLPGKENSKISLSPFLTSDKNTEPRFFFILSCWNNSLMYKSFSVLAEEQFFVLLNTVGPIRVCPCPCARAPLRLLFCSGVSVLYQLGFPYTCFCAAVLSSVESRVHCGLCGNVPRRTELHSNYTHCAACVQTANITNKHKSSGDGWQWFFGSHWMCARVHMVCLSIGISVVTLLTVYQCRGVWVMKGFRSILFT